MQEDPNLFSLLVAALHSEMQLVSQWTYTYKDGTMTKIEGFCKLSRKEHLPLMETIIKAIESLGTIICRAPCISIWSSHAHVCLVLLKKHQNTSYFHAEWWWYHANKQQCMTWRLLFFLQFVRAFELMRQIGKSIMVSFRGT